MISVELVDSVPIWVLRDTTSEEHSRAMPACQYLFKRVVPPVEYSQPCSLYTQVILQKETPLTYIRVCLLTFAAVERCQ